MHCVSHNESCPVGHGPHSMGVHVAKDTLLGRAGVSGTFSEHSETDGLCPLPSEQALRECQPGWGLRPSQPRAEPLAAS